MTVDRRRLFAIVESLYIVRTLTRLFENRTGTRTIVTARQIKHNNLAASYESQLRLFVSLGYHDVR